MEEQFLAEALTSEGFVKLVLSIRGSWELRHKVEDYASGCVRPESIDNPESCGCADVTRQQELRRESTAIRFVPLALRSICAMGATGDRAANG